MVLSVIKAWITFVTNVYCISDIKCMRFLKCSLHECISEMSKSSNVNEHILVCASASD